MSEAAGSELVFVPLGGAGEIGMNLNLYGIDGKWLMVDCGITFADETQPGIDVILPDPSFIAERRDDLVALVLTHAHEDHLGAVAYLWSRLRCPVYATPFTAAILTRKLDEAGLTAEVPLHVVPLGTTLELEPFTVTYVSVTHSIPEGNALAIRTRAGLVFHTGDWKLDPEPLIGEATDEDSIAALGDDGVLAMVCDSTNVFRDGESGSEAAVRASLTDIVGACTGRVCITCFASNVARIETAAAVAEAHGRRLTPVGRSMWRTIEAAREVGYLADLAPPATDHETRALDPSEVLYLCTGCQGEPRGAVSRIAAGDHPAVALGTGDTAIFSARIIPGNERPIGRLHDRLMAAGVEVITEKDRFIHVSGHPARGELERMYGWVRPRISVPVHGEARHLKEHAKLARDLGVPEAVVVENGAVLRLAPGPASIVDVVTVGRLAVDGRTIGPVNSEAVQARRRMTQDGLASATLVVAPDGRLAAAPRIALYGLPEHCEGESVDEAAARALDLALAEVPRAAGDDGFADAARRALRRILKTILGKRPVIEVSVIRLDPEAAGAPQDVTAGP